jgi:mono/diheme cytochrome c family protein
MNHSRIFVWTLAAIVVTLLAGTQFTLAQGSSIWDGVYTAAQADKGKAIYTDKCAACHGDDLNGTASAPALSGNDFMADFNGSNLGELFTRISQTMPANDPGNMKPDEVAGVIAYLASSNKWPAGQKELSTDKDALAQIKIAKK